MTLQVNGSGSLTVPSTITAGYQIGSSVTPSQNFVISVPATPDGTLRISRGILGSTSQDVITIDGSGQLLLNANATSALGAVTKQQFDNLVVTYGVGAGNVFGVWPPTGYSMSHLLGFIPSINQIHFNGDVDNNDSMYCYTNYYGTYMEVVVYNSEQRSTPYANYLAIWKK